MRGLLETRIFLNVASYFGTVARKSVDINVFKKLYWTVSLVLLSLLAEE